jgi:phage baseplate assembly protein W
VSTFAGAPYPIRKNSRGLFHTENGINQIKADLLILLLTNPGERPMLPTFGTPLKQLIFEPNDETLAEQARQMIINSIKTWEPRITVQEIEVTNSFDQDLDPNDDKTEVDNILGIRIMFFDPQDIKEIQELKLEIPLAGGA